MGVEWGCLRGFGFDESDKKEFGENLDPGNGVATKKVKVRAAKNKIKICEKFTFIFLGSG